MDRDVGVVVLRLCELADTVHERERLDEVPELERPLESAVDVTPSRRGHVGSIYDRRRRMTISTENAPGRSLGRGETRRAGREVVLELAFRPLANLLVPWLHRLAVAPPAVVLANAAAGLAAALVLARREPVLAALLLQLKTLLDNADGQLARVSDRVTLTGRYLDTEADLVVNAALFVALGSVTGHPWLALASFCALTVVLTTDFNVSQLYLEVRGERVPPPPASGGLAERLLGAVYAIVFAPQDRLVRWVSRRRFERIVVGEESTEDLRVVALVYHDRRTVTVLANLGLSTQLAVLGTCLVLGVPEVYLWLVLASLLLLPALQLRAERLVRTALAR